MQRPQLCPRLLLQAPGQRSPLGPSGLPGTLCLGLSCRQERGFQRERGRGGRTTSFSALLASWMNLSMTRESQMGCRGASRAGARDPHMTRRGNSPVGTRGKEKGMSRGARTQSGGGWVGLAQHSSRHLPAEHQWGGPTPGSQFHSAAALLNGRRKISPLGLCKGSPARVFAFRGVSPPALPEQRPAAGPHTHTHTRTPASLLQPLCTGLGLPDS